ncbi:hypothetical protein K443DRAFT_674412 [Laccaria amethystina LaAM-08-1]|uniref:Lysine-specific metallo-endopeptidase domain-containing protein n=1 Tax=Laccaria amethystina LaAM-08-1 TaxID=1095629 RepID=A0A0C9Y8C2_9AGAR|nr:hypothetical protein K443DRAFT_674412 [Laccaria amethystina LaAM-08-1]
MFSSSPRFPLFALVASALAVSAAQNLSLEITGPKSVNTVANLKVVATVINTGEKILKLLNEPRSTLSKLPAHTFSIVDQTGASPQFIGIKYKYVQINAAAAKAFTVLAPGQSVRIEHDLSEAYNFTSPGEGIYSFEAQNVFYNVGDNGVITPIYADTQAHSVSLSGQLAIAPSRVSKRATFNGCSSSQQSALNSAAAAAKTYATSALSYANSHTSATSRYTTWFGTYTTARHNTIVSHYSHISSSDFNNFTFDCTCTDSGTYAYVYPNNFGTIYLCDAFWDAPLTGTDSKGGTVIHESSHFTRNGGTNDHVYGQSACKSLAQSNSDFAIQNADSHEYFAENNPALA